MSRPQGWPEFKPYEKDLAKVLGDLEADVLEALWKLESANVKAIHNEVTKKRRVAVTTVATVLDRLFEKKLVNRELKKTRSLHYEYQPSLTKTQLEANVAKTVLNGLLETFGDAVLFHLADRVDIEDKKKLEEFKGYLERLRPEKNE